MKLCNCGILWLLFCELCNVCVCLVTAIFDSRKQILFHSSCFFLNCRILIFFVIFSHTWSFFRVSFWVSLCFCYIRIVMLWYLFLSVCFFHRSLTSNLPNVNLPNVNLPKVPVALPVNLPQMPSFSAPSWMAAIYDSECVFTSH